VSAAAPAGEPAQDDASSPDAGGDGGAPRSQLGGGPSVGQLAAQLLAQLALRLGLAALGGGGSPTEVALSTDALPDGGTPAALLRARTLLVVEAGVCGAACAPRAAIAELTSFAARCAPVRRDAMSQGLTRRLCRIARLESKGAHKLLGRRRTAARRARTLRVSDDCICTWLSLSGFGANA
jgi:hypothetical protein